MKKSIIVKKNKNHIYVIRLALALFVISAVLAVISVGEGAVYIALAFAVLFLPVLLLAGYCETWRIDFGEKICKKGFFVARTYEWRELKETKRYYSFSENGETVVMLFKSGKSLRFCLKDQNAEEAVKIILRHCNIQNV